MSNSQTNEPAQRTENNDTAKTMTLATRWQRLGNMFLDLLFIFILANVLGFVLRLEFIFQGPSRNLVLVIAALVYYMCFEGLFGRTPGKIITKTKAVGRDGAKLTFGQAAIRTLCRLIPLEAFSFLGGEGRPLGWHDRIAKTMVVSLK